MRIRAVDPRDESWGNDDPIYRVYFWSRATGSSGRSLDQVAWASDEYEIEGAPDVEAVLDWARATAGPHRLFTLYVVVRDRDGVGLVRLRGVDPTEHP